MPGFSLDWNMADLVQIGWVMLMLRCEEFAFQLTACIGFLKEGGSIKSQERIL
jgi:hypothetical protein